MEWTDVLFSFDGRINRSTFWLKGVLRVVALALLGSAIFVAGAVVLDFAGVGPAVVVLAYIIVPLMVWANLAVCAKRFHDLGLSGWFNLALFIPYLNVAVLLVLGLVPGNRGDNAYGSPQGVDPWGGRDPWARKSTD